MSDSGDPWWPGSDNPDPSTWFDRPAFANKRDPESVSVGVKGGDYVRGSTVEGLHRSALKYPTSTEAEELIPGKGILYVRPFDYSTTEIQWNIPPEVLEVWDEVSIVRSAFGHPSTVNDGQTIFRATKTELFPGGYQRDENGKPVGVAVERVYDPRDPRKSSDAGLPGGRWYYYGLFFRINKNWVRSIVANTLLPRDHHHADHMWNALPPYYRWMDEQQLAHVGEGPLRKFLRVFGFELDLEREYVESWQMLYNTDFCPGALLRRLGANFGVTYEGGIGDIRYRSLLTRIGYLYRQRGTQECLRKVVEAVTKCQCEITTSENTMLLADDTDFFQGTGHWAGLHPSTPPASVLATAAIPNPVVTVLSPDKIYLAPGIVYTTPVSGAVEPPAGTGRGVMRLWTEGVDATAEIILACGDGIAFDRWDDHGVPITPPETRTLVPRYAGIPVEPTNVYGFSIWVKPPNTSVIFDTLLVWFDKIGNHSSVINYSSRGGAGALPNTNWNLLSTQGTAPTGAAYCVPMIYIRSRPATGGSYSPLIYFGGASFSLLGSNRTVSAEAPDRYLTLGVADEWLGEPRESPAFPGYLMGEQK